MIRFALAVTIASTLLLNGSLATALMPQPLGVCSDDQRVCRISLRMMTPPPPRPAHLATDAAPAPTEATVIRVSAPR